MRPLANTSTKEEIFHFWIDFIDPLTDREKRLLVESPRILKIADVIFLKQHNLYFVIDQEKGKLDDGKDLLLVRRKNYTTSIVFSSPRKYNESDERYLQRIRKENFKGIIFYVSCSEKPQRNHSLQ